MEAYTAQVFQSRLADHLEAADAPGLRPGRRPARSSRTALEWTRTFNACQAGVSWRQVAPAEGQYRWDLFDAQLAWCRRNRLAIEAGPLIEFRKGALPDWLWLWEGDFETIGGLVADYVRQAVSRYKGKVPALARRAPGGRRRDPGPDRGGPGADRRAGRAGGPPGRPLRPGHRSAWTAPGPNGWAAATSSSGRSHLCDYLLRAELGISGIAIEIAPGYSAPGSHIRDLFEFSKLLDLYSLLNVPLHLWMVMPSADGPDPNAEPGIRVEAAQWPGPPDEAIAGELGGAVDRPGHRQAVRPHASTGSRRATPCRTSTRTAA